MMKSRFIYKFKRKLLFLIFILLSVLVYKKILKNTFNQVSKFVIREAKEINEDELDASINNLKSKIKAIDEVLGESSFDENFIQQEILFFLSKKVKENKVEIVKLNPIHFYRENDYMIVTSVFTLKGTYNSLLKIVYEVESELKRSKLNSVSFEKKMNHSTKKNELYVKLFFQNFKRIE